MNTTIRTFLSQGYDKFHSDKLAQDQVPIAAIDSDNAILFSVFLKIGFVTNVSD